MPPTIWRKSSRSTEPDGDCVEVAFALTEAAVRDSKNPTGPTLTFTPDGWRTFAQLSTGKIHIAQIVTPHR